MKIPRYTSPARYADWYCRYHHVTTAPVYTWAIHVSNLRNLLDGLQAHAKQAWGRHPEPTA